MALTWTGFDMPLSSTFSDVLEEFFSNQLQTLTNWQNKGGGVPAASVLFDNGKAGGLLERVSDSKQFAALYNYDYLGVQTDKFQSSSYNHNERFLTTDSLSDLSKIGVFMDNTGSRWANKTEFFGAKSVSCLVISTGGVTGGPFQRGETITIDAAGDNVTATLDEIIYDTPQVILFISNCSAEPSSNWNSKTVTGGTSGASATTHSSAMPGRHWHVGVSNTFDLRSGPDFPVATDVLTGATTGYTATVATATPSTGRITVSSLLGRFQLNETVTWNAGANSASIGWGPPNWDVVNGMGLTITDYTVDDTTNLIGEDADRLILLIPDVANNRYNILAFGKWWDSAEGQGRMDGAFAGIPIYLAGNSLPDGGVGFFLDSDGVLWNYKNNICGQNYNAIGYFVVNLAPNTQAAGYKIQYWGNSLSSASIQEHEQPASMVLGSTGYDMQRTPAKLPELFTLAAQSFRTVTEPGSWSGKQSIALHLDTQGRCIEYNNTVLTP